MFDAEKLFWYIIFSAFDTLPTTNKAQVSRSSENNNYNSFDQYTEILNDRWYTNTNDRWKTLRRQ